MGPYAATKFAVNGFFGSMQHELAMQRSNVSLTITTLGLIDTDSAMDKIRLVTGAIYTRVFNRIRDLYSTTLVSSEIDS